jgi:hypothetical protein
MASPPETAPRRRRLILRVSSRHDVETGLPISLELAAALRSDLATLFVTDETPLAACALPFPTMIGFSGGALALDPLRFEAAVRREAEACRRLLAQAAERARLAWTFEALRGEARRLLRDATSVEDILVIGLDRLTPLAADAIAQAREVAPDRGGVLFVRERTVLRQGPIVVIDDAGTGAAGLVHLAETLSGALGSPVLRVSRSAEEYTVAMMRARLLLAPIESSVLDDPAALRRIAAALKAPLLLLRTQSLE